MPSRINVAVKAQPAKDQARRRRDLDLELRLTPRVIPSPIAQSKGSTNQIPSVAPSFRSTRAATWRYSEGSHRSRCLGVRIPPIFRSLYRLDRSDSLAEGWQHTHAVVHDVEVVFMPTSPRVAEHCQQGLQANQFVAGQPVAAVGPIDLGPRPSFDASGQFLVQLHKAMEAGIVGGALDNVVLLRRPHGTTRTGFAEQVCAA